MMKSHKRIALSSHTYVVPHDAAKFLVDRIYRLLTLDVHHPVDLVVDSLFCFSKFRKIGREARNSDLVGQVVLDSVRQYEVTVGQTLHQCRCTEAVGTVVREVTLADGEQALH